jgi:hypothetical protein
MFDHAGFSGVEYLLANANPTTDRPAKRGLLVTLGLAVSSAISAASTACRRVMSRSCM